MLERLQKILSQAGIASRRQAETMITAGKVAVNGEVITELGSKADPDQDMIVVEESISARSIRALLSNASEMKMHLSIGVTQTFKLKVRL